LKKRIRKITLEKEELIEVDVSIAEINEINAYAKIQLYNEQEIKLKIQPIKYLSYIIGRIWSCIDMADDL